MAALAKLAGELLRALRLGAALAAQGQGEPDDERRHLVLPRDAVNRLELTAATVALDGPQGHCHAAIGVADGDADPPVADIEAEGSPRSPRCRTRPFDKLRTR